jgi:hypothetical protein
MGRLYEKQCPRALYENPFEIALKKVRKIGTFSGRFSLHLAIESRGDFTMVRAGKRVAIYSRVSTKDKGQTTENQRLALEQWAANAGAPRAATSARSSMRCLRQLSGASST